MCGLPSLSERIERMDQIRRDDTIQPALSQWETSLQSIAVFHWLDTNIESALPYIVSNQNFSYIISFKILKI